MAQARDPYAMAVAEIRARLRSGRLVLGEQLMVGELARELGLSPTPVREALARLAGEGLIDDRRGAGHFAWRLDAVDLAELYELQAVYLLAALQRSASASAAASATTPAPAAPPAPAEGEALLYELVQRGRSLTLLRAHAILADRLAPARRVEPEVLGDIAQEVSDLRTLLAAHDVAGLTAWSLAYRDRRLTAAPQIVATMRIAATRR